MTVVVETRVASHDGTLIMFTLQIEYRHGDKYVNWM